MAYDRKRNVVVMYGGANDDTLALDELWELAGSTWSKKTFTGAAPGARTGARLTWNPVTERVLLVGGYTGSVYMKDAWEWDGNSWTPVASVAAGGAMDYWDAGLATDLSRRRVVLVARDGAVREYDGTSWTVVAPAPVAGVARVAGGLALDPTRRELILFGGQDSSAVATATTFRFRGQWYQVPVTGPAARSYTALAYDPLHDEMVLFGGAASNFVPLADTVIYKPSSPSWVTRTPLASPPPRSGHSMVWDGNANRIVLFGGNGGTGVGVIDDTWTWNGINWTPEPAATKPPPRENFAMGYDPIRKRVVIFGGRRTLPLQNDTWLWDGSTWTELTVGNRPPGREYAEMAWDPARGRLILFGGAGAESFNDAWELTEDGWQFVPTSFAELARADHMMASAPDGSGVVVVGGAFYEAGTYFGDTRRLRWDGSDAGEEVCTAVDFDGDALAGCTDPDCGYVCTRCGNGTCDRDLETCGLCPADCGACAN
jgi:hypothetical protein